MTKTIATSLENEVYVKWSAYLEKFPTLSQSEVLRSLVMQALNKEALTPLPKPSVLQQARKNNPFLDEPFKCRISGDRVKVRDLPCVTDADLQCRDPQCQRYIKQRLGLS